jgi:hypothetical protein
VLTRNGVDTAEAVVVANLFVGGYRLTTTIPEDWSKYDQVSVRIAAAVEGVTDAWPVWQASLADPDLLTLLDSLNLRVPGEPAAIGSAMTLTPSERDALAGIISEQLLEDLHGDGSVAVNHNYGGVDALAVATTVGARVDNALIRIYRASDYSAGNVGSEFIVASSTTNVDGRWIWPVMLDPGDYVLYIFKPGHIRPSATDLTVA